MSVDTITLKTLSSEKTPFNNYRIEIHALDASWYVVRLHHALGVKELVEENGDIQRFAGTQWISRVLRPLGFEQAVLTHSDVHDEMIGAPTQTVSPEERLAFGTRVALQT
ncbi:DUF6482 family protein [Vreelandella sp. EE22]